jgi:hypothetical protein
MKIKKLRKKLKKIQKSHGNLEVVLPQVVNLGQPDEKHYHARILYAEIGVKDRKYVVTIY